MNLSSTVLSSENIIAGILVVFLILFSCAAVYLNIFCKRVPKIEEEDPEIMPRNVEHVDRYDI